jgi:hypothetical protein
MMVLLALYRPVVGMSQARYHPRDIPLECRAPFLSFHRLLVRSLDEDVNHPGMAASALHLSPKFKPLSVKQSIQSLLIHI